MAAFERERSSRRWFFQNGEAFPKPSGGVPGGSIAQNVDTGERFIYNGDSQVWLDYVGEEDQLSVLEDIREGIGDLLSHMKVTRAAVATIANCIDDGSNFSTDDD